SSWSRGSRRRSAISATPCASAICRISGRPAHLILARAPPYITANGYDWFEVSRRTQMLNIARFSPLEDAFENIFRGMPVWLPNPETRTPAPTPFRMDVTENDKEYRVLAELPGVK